MEVKKTLVRFPKRAISHLVAHVTRQIGVGLLIVIPFLVVYWVVKWLANNIDTLFDPLIKIMPFVNAIPGTGLVLLLIVLYAVGLIAMHTFGRKAIRFVQHITLKIPFIKSIYKPAKGFVDTFSNSPLAASRVVMITLFQDSNPVFALYTSTIIVNGQEYVNVYYPTPPTLTSGIAVIKLVEEVCEVFIKIATEEGNEELVPMSVSDLMNYCISCGSFSPENVITRPLAIQK